MILNNKPVPRALLCLGNTQLTVPVSTVINLISTIHAYPVEVWDAYLYNTVPGVAK